MGEERFRRSKLTLRFLNPAEEDAFNRSRKQRMLGNLSVLLFVMSGIVIPLVLFRVFLVRVPEAKNMLLFKNKQKPFFSYFLVT